MSGHLLIYLVYAVSYFLIGYIPEYSRIIFGLLSCINIFIWLTKRKYKDIALFSTCLIGNELIAILNVLVFIAIENAVQPKKMCTKIKRHTLIVVTIVLCTSFVSAMSYGTYLNVIFYVGYFLLLAITYKNVNIEISDKKVLQFIHGFTIAELVATIGIIFRTRTITPGDVFGGTLLNAHFFANWLVLTSFVYLYVITKTRSKLLKELPYLIAIVAMIILASANAVLVAAAISVFVNFFFSINKKKDNNNIFWMIIFTYAGFAIFLLVLFSDPVKTFIMEKSYYLSLYLYSDTWNYKLNYFYGTFFKNLQGIRALTGYGLGQYGSRIANAFCYDVMWRNEGGINDIIASLFQPHHIPQYVEYIKFYDKNFVDAIQWRSAVMSYPFSSFVALIGETGIIGVVAVASWINKSFKNFPCKIIIFYFLIVCIFDIFFDDYLCVLALIVYLGFIKRGHVTAKEVDGN